MASAPTYYDFLGVTPTASGEQIRSAYLLLMKQHHPDLTDQTDKRRASDFAAFLNRSYDVLKDPHRRARYDAYITFQARERRNPRIRQRPLLAGETYRRRARRWDASSIGVAILASLIAAISIAAASMQSRTPYVFAEALPPVQPPAASAAATNLSIRDVRKQTRLAMLATPDEAQLESQACFGSVSDQSSARAAELCVIFDDAYVDWNEVASGGINDSEYFNEALVRLRQQNAMAAVRSFDESRLNQLRQLALNSLLAEIRSKMDPGMSSETGDQEGQAGAQVQKPLSR
jgi:DnaJ domain